VVMDTAIVTDMATVQDLEQVVQVDFPVLPVPAVLTDLEPAAARAPSNQAVMLVV